MSDELLFADLKVIDMSSWIAAPVAATILADFGAQVIKVEPPIAWRRLSKLCHDGVVAHQ
jgi:formyl-CoA transferase